MSHPSNLAAKIRLVYTRHNIVSHSAVLARPDIIRRLARHVFRQASNSRARVILVTARCTLKQAWHKGYQLGNARRFRLKNYDRNYAEKPSTQKGIAPLVLKSPSAAAYFHFCAAMERRRDTSTHLNAAFTTFSAASMAGVGLDHDSTNSSSRKSSSASSFCLCKYTKYEHDKVAIPPTTAPGHMHDSRTCSFFFRHHYFTLSIPIRQPQT